MSTESQRLIREDCIRILAENHVSIAALKNSVLAVTGGTGFVGTWIAEMIRALNDDFQFNTKLILIARDITTFQEKKAHLSQRNDITLLASDVRQLSNFPMQADWVIHAATSPDVRFHASNPLDTASIIVDGTMSVLKTAERMSDLKRLLYISSGLVCHNKTTPNTGLTEKETAAPLPNASFIYPNAKRYAEALCSAARAQSRVPVVIARPFSFIGPYQSLDTPWAQTTFLSDALKGINIRIQGDGQVVRSYLYGSDAAYWFLNLLVNGEVGDVVNVGNDEGIALQDLALTVAKQFSPTPDIVFNTSNNRNNSRPSYFIPDTRHAHADYGLQVYTDLDQAVASTAKWHQLQNQTLAKD